ncbi:hypothetical protein C0992_011303 [Termitomyces sp. T32_za158]|nr:hypothetical protein C0992_011303 [Termitomyces sp. T32_za158]
MLTLGPGSVCDICIEAFGTGLKVASAIICGHVFCSECIDKLRTAPPTTNHPDPNYKPCPLCRHTFDTRSYIRLHVDHDNNPNPRPAIRVAAVPTVSKEDAQTVQCLLERMISITNEGSSEEESRQCITEVRTFLKRQKDVKQFIELQACFRMLVYIINVRATNRQLQAQKTDLEASLNQAREEKAVVEGRARDERDLAISVEKSLQNHAKLTRDGYEAIIIRDEHVAAEPGNFMISPLAAYSALPTRPFVFPEESEVEMLPKSHSQSPTSFNLDHPADYVVPSPGIPQPTHRSSACHSHSTTAFDRPVPNSEPCKPLPINSSDPSASISVRQTEFEAAGTDDYRSRMPRDYKHHSHDHRPHSYSSSHEENTQSSSSLHTPGSISRLHDSVSLSVDETQPLEGISPLATTSSPKGHLSPLHISGSTSRSEHRESIPKENSPVVATTAPAPSSESPQRQSIRNHMLQGLLRDTIPTSGSSSQISPSIPSTSSPAVPRHESHGSDERKGSSLGHYTLPRPSPSLVAERRELHRQESLRKSEARNIQDEDMNIPPLTLVSSRPTHSSYDHAYVPAPMIYDPSSVSISSASGAAKAKARERAEKAMDEKRTEKDKDSIRKKAEREERRRSKRAEAWNPSYPGESSSSWKNRWPSDSYGANASNRTHQGISSSRHISSYDPPPPYTSASQHASGSGRGRYAEKYASSHRNKYTLAHILSPAPRA